MKHFILQTYLLTLSTSYLDSTHLLDLLSSHCWTSHLVGMFQSRKHFEVQWDLILQMSYPGASNEIYPPNDHSWSLLVVIYEILPCHLLKYTNITDATKSPDISCGFMVVPKLAFQQCGRCSVYLVITAPWRAAMILWCLMFFDVWQSGFKKVMNTKKESTQFLGHWSFGHLMLRNLLVLLKITHVISRRSKIQDCNQQLSLLRQCLERMFWMNAFHNFHRSTVFSWLSLIIT